MFVDIPFCRARIFGKGRRKIWKGSWKVFLKKGARITGTALGLPSHYALHVLRPYHGEDGSIFVKRSGATRDADLLSPQRLNAGNSELLNRPGKGITMLAGTIFHGLSAISYAEKHPGRNGLGVWDIYLDASYILAPNAGKYSSPMVEHMDKVWKKYYSWFSIPKQPPFGCMKPFK